MPRPSRPSSTASRSSRRDGRHLRLRDIGIVIHGTTLATNALIERRGAKHGAGHHRRLSRRHRDADREPLRAVRSEPHACRRRWSPRATGSRVQGAIDARGQGAVSRSTRPRSTALAERLAAGGYRRRRDRLHPLLRQPDAHERPVREMRCRGGCRRADLDLVARFRRRCANSSGSTPSAPTPMCKPADGRLSRPPAVSAARHGRRLPGVHDPFRRRPDLGRNGGGVSRCAWSSPAGRRRHLRRRHRPPLRLDKVVSYDMGGTTAKICLIEDFAPKTARDLRGRAHLPLQQGLAACRSRSRSSR